MAETMTGHREGSLWREDDGTYKTLEQKASEALEPLPPDAPRNYGTLEFQKASERYMRMLFGDDMVDAELERLGRKSLLDEDCEDA